MAINDYSNPSENILFASFEDNLASHNGKTFTFNSFADATRVTFEEDDIAGKHVLVPAKSYLKISDPDIALGTGDFTMDFWAYRIGDYCSVSNHTKEAETGICFHTHTNYAFLGIAYTSLQYLFPMPSGTSKWQHFAMVRKKGMIYVFVDGISTASGPVNIDLACEEIVINAGHSNWPEGYCASENRYKALRLCNFARWTEDFTPPDPKEAGSYGPGSEDMNLHILLDVNERVDLTGYIHPVAPDVPQLVWSSANESIASVDQNGKVTGKAMGTTKILVKTPDGSWSAFARVIVEAEGTSQLRLSVLLEPMESCRLKAVFVPKDTDKPVIWLSSNTAVATVASNGRVTAVAEGETIVTVQTVDGSLSDYIYVTVTNK